ncbi:hypothetical protein HYFRA_00004765 [Hymenoscyphus fraxineus]|uniref:COPI associated n=1 Tax=Hymenoscyphus fraxineus TaxID=746836 RepID=A0A9N9KLE7_9HELO|nr:hypothetical protein HYFRA_00004765 [Hymenoscyphus fraxineus]
MDFSDAFRIVNLAVGGLLTFSGFWNLFPFAFSHLMVGIYVVLFGLCKSGDYHPSGLVLEFGATTLANQIHILMLSAEFQIPPQLSRYASFLFSFIGRGLFYIFTGSIVLGNGIVSNFTGGSIALVGLAYCVLEFIPSIEPPQNMREADGGWGAEQV